MLSYRHAFHAGNHADVLKHAVLVALCDYLNQKEKPYWYIDTHAGAGKYALNSVQTTKLKEYREGIQRLWSQNTLTPLLENYVSHVRRINPDGKLQIYPGSPLLAFNAMRPQDRLRLFEKHRKDADFLAENFAHGKKRVHIDYADGFAGLKSLLPPPPRRSLVLIDPSYEEKRDYELVVLALKDALGRFSTGTYMLWYPQLTRRESHDLPGRLKRLSKCWLHTTLRVKTPSADGMGMHGSGLFIINPPWVLHKALEESLPILLDLLRQDEGAGFTLEQALE